MADSGAPVLLAVSHGTSSRAGRTAVAALVDAVSDREAATIVRGGFVDVQRPNVRDLIDALAPDQAAVIVPLLLSAGYHVHVDITDEATATSHAVVVADALGPDDRLTSVLLRRLGEAGATAADNIVLAVAGSSDERAVEDCRDMGRRASVALGRPVELGFLAAATPSLSEAILSARADAAGGQVVVSSYLLAPGYFQDLVLAAGADVVTEPLLVADAPVPPELVALVCDRYRAAVPTH